MSEKNIEIKEFSVNDLEKELNKPDFFKGQEHLPITKHRAVSQVNNPRAEKHDIILLVALNNKEICGYIGMLPDYIYNNTKKTKIAWLTAWWVSPKVKGQGIGYKLMQQAFLKYNNRIGAISPSKDSLRVFKKSKEFIFINYGESINYIFRYSKTVNSKKISFLKSVIFDIINTFISIKLHLWLRQNILSNKFNYFETKELSGDTIDFINDKNNKSLFKWNKTEFEWMVKYPWLISKKENEKYREYYFSAYADQYFYKMIEVRYNGNIIGFFVLRFRDLFVTLPYAFFDESYKDEVLIIILKYIKQYKAFTLTITNEVLAKTIAKLKIPFISQNSFYNELMLSKNFNFIKFDDFCIQDGTGDNAFT